MKKRGESPVGIRILTYYTITLILTYLLVGAREQKTLLFGHTITGDVATVLSIIYILILALIIQSFYRPFLSEWYLAIGWFTFEALSSLVTLLTNSLPDIINIALLSIVLLDSFIVWYLWTKKAFFRGLETHSTKHDRIFAATLGGFLIIATIAAAAITIKLYNDTTKKTDIIIDQLDKKTFGEAMEVCKVSEEKDICYLTLATVYDEIAFNICDLIEHPLYRFTCIEART